MLPSIYSENLFDDFFSDPFDMVMPRSLNALYGKHGKNLMKTDVRETEDTYELDIDLPGFKKDEVNLELKDGYLTIQAAKGLDKEELLEQIVREALLLSPKSKRIKEIRENLKKAFHIEHSKRPYSIQGGEWPMGKNSPMQYISRSKIPDGVKYIFQDVDTGEIREIEQFY